MLITFHHPTWMAVDDSDVEGKTDIALCTIIEVTATIVIHIFT